MSDECVAGKRDWAFFSLRLKKHKMRLHTALGRVLLRDIALEDLLRIQIYPRNGGKREDQSGCGRRRRSLLFRMFWELGVALQIEYLPVRRAKYVLN